MAEDKPRQSSYKMFGIERRF